MSQTNLYLWDSALFPWQPCFVRHNYPKFELSRLCQNFNLTPTFAKIDKERSSKWKQSSEAFGRNVISEELKEKIKQSASLKQEINSIYNEICQSCSLFCYASISRTMVNLRNKHYQEVMSTYTKKIVRLLYKETDVDEPHPLALTKQ